MTSATEPIDVCLWQGGRVQFTRHYLHMHAGNEIGGYSCATQRATMTRLRTYINLDDQTTGLWLEPCSLTLQRMHWHTH